MITSGRNSRITRTMSPRTAWRSQTFSVSSAFFEYPKSFARVKYCRPPSSRRAASSSCVRATPSASPSWGPSRFCPPSPRVSER